MVSKELIGGLVAALSRGESFQKAMVTFYNAGYGKDEIEKAAAELYKQTGGQAENIMKPKPESVGAKPLPKPVSQVPVKEHPIDYAKLIASAKPSAPISKPIAPAQPAPKKEPEKPIVQKQIIPMQEVSKKPEEGTGREIEERLAEEKLRPIQIISKYGESEDTSELRQKLDTAIEELRGIKLPSKLEIRNIEAQSKPPIIIQKISDYSGGPPKPINKTVTILLIILLIILLGALAAVFFFREELIDIFNTFGLE